jgi:hypothetical protein
MRKLFSFGVGAAGDGDLGGGRGDGDLGGGGCCTGKVGGGGGGLAGGCGDVEAGVDVADEVAERAEKNDPRPAPQELIRPAAALRSGESGEVGDCACVGDCGLADAAAPSASLRAMTSTPLALVLLDAGGDDSDGVRCIQRPRTPSTALRKFVEPAASVRETASRAGASCCSSLRSWMPSDSRRPMSEIADGLSPQGCLSCMVSERTVGRRGAGGAPRLDDVEQHRVCDALPDLERVRPFELGYPHGVEVHLCVRVACSAFSDPARAERVNERTARARRDEHARVLALEEEVRILDRCQRGGDVLLKLDTQVVV